MQSSLAAPEGQDLKEQEPLGQRVQSAKSAQSSSENHLQEIAQHNRNQRQQSQGQASQEQERQQQRLSIKHDGMNRTYNLYVPPSYCGGTAVPLLIALHGGGGIGRRMLAFTGFGTIADHERFIVVCPDGFERHWNDGRDTTGHKAHEQKLDDVGFIAAVIDKICADYKIDKNRIYATGISNGGMMSYRLGLELSDRIAAIAPVVGALPVNLVEKAKESGAHVRRMPAIIFNGTEDPLVPWSGGEVKFFMKKLGKVASVQDSVSIWASRNACAPKPRVSSVPVKDEGLKVVKTQYENCAAGADVIFYAVEGGGHTWPGPEPSAQYLPTRLIGRACHDLNASELIWEFFKTQKLN